MELRPPKDIFKGLHYPLTWLNGFCSGRGKRGALIYKKKEGAHDIELLKKSNFQNFLEGREGDNKRRPRMVKLIFFFIKTTLFGHGFKDSTYLLFGAWSFLLVHIWFTPSEGPKGFANWFLEKSNLGSWTMKSDHGKIITFHGLTSLSMV